MSKNSVLFYITFIITLFIISNKFIEISACNCPGDTICCYIGQLRLLPMMAQCKFEFINFL